ncbi:MAG: acyl-CoA thioesterase [Flavobacteriales bacterium]|nr:acyl-CoA thioesterase [Flavobacteriales bacterium]
MFEHRSTFRVRYGETDRMGYMYHGRYAELFEVGRVEALRALGIRYLELEERGVLLPVREMHIVYHAPARYDDALTVITRVVSMPNVRMLFTYEVRNEREDLLTEAEVTLVFIQAATGKPCRAPAWVIEKLGPYLR